MIDVFFLGFMVYGKEEEVVDGVYYEDDVCSCM